MTFCTEWKLRSLPVSGLPLAPLLPLLPLDSALCAAVPAPGQPLVEAAGAAPPAIAHGLPQLPACLADGFTGANSIGGRALPAAAWRPFSLAALPA